MGRVGNAKMIKGSGEGVKMSPLPLLLDNDRFLTPYPHPAPTPVRRLLHVTARGGAGGAVSWCELLAARGAEDNSLF